MKRRPCGFDSHRSLQVSTRSASAWHMALEATGAPSEVVNPEGGRNIFKDPELRKRKWLVSHQQHLIGLFEHTGLLFD
jgi:hypothetical protein